MSKNKSGWVPNPEHVSKRRIRAAKLFVSPLLIGIAIGGYIGLNYEVNDSTANDKAKAVFKTADLEIKTSQKNLAVASEEAGSRCMLVLADYLPGSRLASADSSSATDDLLAEPGQPCGQNQRTVHGLVALVRSSTQSHNEASDTYNDATKKLESTTRIEQDNEFEDDIVLGGLIGAAAGLVLTALGVAEYNAIERRKYRESQIAESNRKTEIDLDYVEHLRRLELQQAAKEFRDE